MTTKNLRSLSGTALIVFIAVISRNSMSERGILQLDAILGAG
ncbi:hypothetical protein FHT86_006394 [Rhizobium sp. BK313]|nr:hypothetical protein [Rhizobium sp. BK313]MBB3458069.1 hypothetical protein [Rhizobium sp. BK313]